MELDTTPSTLKRIDYASVFAFTRLFQCFRMAIAPSRMLLSLLFIVLFYIVGMTLDGVWGPQAVAQKTSFSPQVEHSEWFQYKKKSAKDFSDYLSGWSAEREKKKANLGGDAYAIYVKNNFRGVFAETLDIQAHLFQNLVHAAIGLRIGFDQISPAVAPNDATVIGALRQLTLTLPGWLWHGHTGYLIVMLSITGVLWALLGGAVSRQMVVAGAIDRIVPMTEAFVFSYRRLPTYVIAPLVPLVLVLGLALLMAIGGILFYIPGVNILAGLLFGLSLLVSFVATLLLVVWFGGVHMIYPAIAAQGSDALDAFSRAISYVMSRPWRLFFYSLVAIVYGAATYVFVGLFAYLMICVAHWAVGVWVSGFEYTFPNPRFGEFPQAVMETTVNNATRPTGPEKAAGFLIMVWQYLLIGVVGAYAINFYLAAYAHIYLLLRKVTDGDDYSEVFEPYPVAPVVAAVEKIEPPSGAAAVPDPDSTVE